MYASKKNGRLPLRVSGADLSRVQDAWSERKSRISHDVDSRKLVWMSPGLSREAAGLRLDTEKSIGRRHSSQPQTLHTEPKKKLEILGGHGLISETGGEGHACGRGGGFDRTAIARAKVDLHGGVVFFYLWWRGDTWKDAVEHVRSRRPWHRFSHGRRREGGR